MSITNIRIRTFTKQEDQEALAVASFCVEGCFVIRGVRLMRSVNGSRYLAMPSRRLPDGSYQDMAHPLTFEHRIELTDRIFAAYEATLFGRAAS